jgi:hypothetical protein
VTLAGAWLAGKDEPAWPVCQIAKPSKSEALDFVRSFLNIRMADFKV